LIILLGGFTTFLIRSYLHSDDRLERRAAEEANAAEDKGDEGGGKEYEGDGKVN
jgi:hypothetical protein